MLEGKQVWYFTAPATLPISVIEKVPISLEKAQRGEAILEHEGDEYGVSFEDPTTSSSLKIVVPNTAGDKYGLCKWLIHQLVLKGYMLTTI